MITSSWPAARELVDHPSHAQVIDQHVQRIRNQITEIRGSGREVREIAFYDKPPLESAAGALLLMLAHRLSTVGDADTLRQFLRPLVADAPAGMPLWTRQFLVGDGYCSPGMRTALGLAIGCPHALRTLGIRPQRTLTPPPQAVGFGVDYIPQHLLPEWHAEYLGGFNEVKSHLLRRAAAARLAQICVGGHIADAAELLGIPRDATTNAIPVVKHHLHARTRRAFSHPSTASPKTWITLPTALTTATDAAHSVTGPSPKTIGPRWSRTSPSNPYPGSPAPISTGATATHPRLHLGLGPHHRRRAHLPTGHYTALRARLDTYADKLTATIDKQSVTSRLAMTTTACM